MEAWAICDTELGASPPKPVAGWIRMTREKAVALRDKSVIQPYREDFPIKRVRIEIIEDESIKRGEV